MGPNALDRPFGPEVRFSSLPEGFKPGVGTAPGLQFFGTVRIDGRTEELTVTHYNAAGEKLRGITLPPEPRRGG